MCNCLAFVGMTGKPFLPFFKLKSPVYVVPKSFFFAFLFRFNTDFAIIFLVEFQYLCPRSLSFLLPVLSAGISTLCSL